MSGKGSNRRPGEGYEDNHGRIFGERPKKARYVPPALPVDSAQGQAQDGDSINPTGARMREGIGLA